MKKRLVFCLVTITGFLLLSATYGFSFGSFGTDVNSLCAPAVPYTGGNCALCHTANTADPTDAKTAYLAGGTALTDFFCPSTPPTCTDSDNDTYATEGGDCGPIDCNDNSAAINPGATEICGDGIDQNCDGNDPVCPPPACTDSDGDSFATDGGDCGPIDCNDNSASIYPSATEICGDGIDQNCNGSDQSCSNANIAPIQLLLQEAP